MKTITGLFLTMSLLSTSAFADLYFHNKRVMDVKITENDVVVSVETRKICRTAENPTGLGCKIETQSARLPENPNKAAMLQLLINAHLNVHRVDVLMTEINGTQTIIGVSSSK